MHDIFGPGPNDLYEWNGYGQAPQIPAPYQQPDQ